MSTSRSAWCWAIKNASSPYKALQLYAQMHRQSIPFDSFSILYTLKACTHLQNLTLLRHLHAHVSKLGFTSNVHVLSSLLNGYANACLDDACQLFDEMPERSTVTWNTMITGFSRMGSVNKARSVFEKMPKRDISSWSAMISAYIINGCWNEGFAIFREMVVDEKLKPDQATFGSVLVGCGRIGSVGLVLGRSIHGYVVKNDWEVNVKLGTALVDMYAKCGCLNVAIMVFEIMRDRNVISWTALICGAAQHGHIREARFFFERMQEMGIKPNEFTFTGILNACVQAGLVEEGHRYFEMIKDYGLKPRIHHYCCMVDLFGKAGKLEDAYEVMETMPLEPDIHILCSFLSSCKVQENFKMAERVIDRIMQIVKPEKHGGIYALISDLYVLGEKWADAERVRRSMVSQNVRKVRGSSFIGNGTPYRDVSNSQTTPHSCCLS